MLSIVYAVGTGGQYILLLDLFSYWSVNHIRELKAVIIMCFLNINRLSDCFYAILFFFYIPAIYLLYSFIQLSS